MVLFSLFEEQCARKPRTTLGSWTASPGAFPRRSTTSLRRPRRTPAPAATSACRLTRTWIALLRGRVRASLAATLGVEDARNVAKACWRGADAGYASGMRAANTGSYSSW